MVRFLFSLFCIAFTLCISGEVFAQSTAACKAIQDKRDNLQRVCTQVEARRVGGCQPFKLEIINLDNRLRKNCPIIATYDYEGGVGDLPILNVCDIEYNTWKTRTSSTFTPDFESQVEKNAYLFVLGGDPQNLENEDDAIVATQFVALRKMLDDAVSSITKEERSSEEFKQFQSSIDSALLSYDVYSDESIPGVLPKGVSRVGPSDLAGLGLLNDDLVDEESGYYSAIYKDKRDGAVKYIYVNRGTEGPPIGFDKDGGSNVSQNLGKSSQQHAIAMRNAKRLKARIDKLNEENGPPYKPITLSFSGHSLGGGLASAQALATNLPANVINPAGLHKNTLETVGADLSQANELINAYIVEGEILNAVNGSGNLPWWVDKLVGNDHNHRIVQQSYGKKTYLPDFQSGTLGGRSFKDSWSGWNHALDKHGVHIALKGLIINWCKGKFGN